MTLIEVSPGYHNLKPDERSSYLTISSCQRYRYRHMWLLFGAAPMGTRFQRKIDEISKELTNVFGIADSNGADYDRTLCTVFQICRKEILKLNNIISGVHLFPFFGKGISRQGVRTDLRKLKALTDMPHLKSKNQLQRFLGIMNYVSKFSPATAEVCESLWWLISVNKEWT